MFVVKGQRRHFVARISSGRSQPAASTFMRDERTPAAQAPACGSATRQQWPPRSSAGLRSASAARHRSLACSGRYRPPPRHANCNQMPAASPWDRARTWRHNDCRIRVTLADLSVDIVPIVRPISSKRRNRHRNLLKQGADLRAVIDILAGQVGGDDLSSVGVDTDVELSPGPTRPCGMLLDQPLTGTAELEPCAVDQQVYRSAARWWLRHLQCLAPSAHGRMVWRREIKTEQPKKGCDQPFGLAERQAENRPQRQRRRDRQRRVARLVAARGAWLGLPRRYRGFGEPDGQAAALAQRDVIGGPIRHSVPLLRDVVTAILVRFEWHGNCPESGTGPPSYTVHSSPPNDQS